MQSAAERVAGILILGPARLPRSLIENAAIALGRLAMMAPSVVAPHLPHFFVPWCQVGGLLAVPFPSGLVPGGQVYWQYWQCPSRLI